MKKARRGIVFQENSVWKIKIRHPKGNFENFNIDPFFLKINPGDTVRIINKELLEDDEWEEEQDYLNNSCEVYSIDKKKNIVELEMTYPISSEYSSSLSDISKVFENQSLYGYLIKDNLFSPIGELFDQEAILSNVKLLTETEEKFFDDINETLHERIQYEILIQAIIDSRSKGWSYIETKDGSFIIENKNE